VALTKLNPVGFAGATQQELKFLHTQLLELLLEFDEICRKHNIQWYLDGGSVIGAVRHRGFVPWDDDVDILIKQTEWERLLAVIDDELASRPNRLLAFSGRPHDHHRTFARFVRTDVPHVVRNTMVEANYKPGIFLDIFILDGVPAKHLPRYRAKLEACELWYHKRLLGVKEPSDPKLYRRFNRMEKVLGRRRLERLFTRQLTRWKNDPADYYVPRSGWNYAVYDADVFQEPTYLEFEGHMLPVPTLPEKYLRGHYGTRWYMLPPKNERAFTHYTFTSTELTTDDFLSAYNWLDHHEEIVASKESEYLLRIHRKPSRDRAALLTAQVRFVAAALDLPRRLPIEHAHQLRRDHATREIVRLSTRFINATRGVLKRGPMPSDAPEIDASLIECIAYALTSEGRAEEAAKILSLVPAPSTELKELIRDSIELIKSLQDRDHTRAEQLVARHLPQHPRLVPFLTADAVLHPDSYGPERLASLLDALDGRAGNLDGLRLQYGCALSEAGETDAANAVFQRLVKSDNGLVALTARTRLFDLPTAASLDTAETEVVATDTTELVAVASETVPGEVLDPDAIDTKVLDPDAAEADEVVVETDTAEIADGESDAAELADGETDELEQLIEAGPRTVRLDDIQEVQLTLLARFEELCASHGVSYSVGGLAAVDYVRNGALTRRGDHVLQVLLVPEELAKVVALDPASLPSGTGLEGTFNNPRLKGRVVRFYDESTLYFDPYDSRSRAQCIHIELVPLQVSTLTRTRSDAAGADSFRPLAHVISEVPSARFYFDPARIEQTTEIMLNGVRTRIFTEFLDHPRQVLSRIDSISLHPFRAHRPISSRHVSYAEYRRYVRRPMILALREATKEQLDWLGKIDEHNRDDFSADNQALRVAFHIHELKLRHEFLGSAEQLAELRAANDTQGLRSYLKKYRAIFRFFFDRDRIMVPTEDAFEALIELLRAEGRTKYVRQILELRARTGSDGASSDLVRDATRKA